MRWSFLNYRQILEEEAAKRGIRVSYHDRGAQWGRAALGSKRVFIPTPHRFTSFFTGLHEIGHIARNHHARDGKPEYLWEYEAFNWALEFCRKRGIRVPVKTLNYERDIIAEKVREEAESGAKRIDSRIVRFVKKGSSRDPDVAFVKKSISDEGVIIAPLD
jgi:hypothetical protein